LVDAVRRLAMPGGPAHGRKIGFNREAEQARGNSEGRARRVLCAAMKSRIEPCVHKGRPYAGSFIEVFSSLHWCRAARMVQGGAEPPVAHGAANRCKSARSIGAIGR
jgi:hypothetical protein